MKGSRAIVESLFLLAVLLAGCGRDEPIEQPVPLYGEEPVEYPLTLWDQRVEGETQLRVRVTETGTVDSVEVASTSGHASLDSAAVAGVKDLRFQPGRQGGKRIRVWVTIPVLFSTRPDAGAAAVGIMGGGASGAGGAEAEEVEAGSAEAGAMD